MYAEIIVDIKIKSLDKPFDYEVPESLLALCEVGMSVLVPFHHQMVKGIIVRLKEESDYEDIKKIEALDSFMPIISDQQWALIEYLRKIYRLMMSQAFDIVMPTVFQSNIHTSIKLIKDHDFFPNHNILFNHDGFYELKKSDLKHIKALRQLAKDQYIEFSYTLLKKTYISTSLYQFIGHSNTKFRQYTDQLQLNLTYKRQDLLSLGIKDSGIKTLLKHNLLRRFDQDDIRSKTIKKHEDTDIEVKNSIFIQSKYTFIDTLKKIITRHVIINENLLVIVPNQHILHDLKNQLEDDCHYYHGSLTMKEKQKVIENLHNKNIVIGTRSALFLPFHILHTIIILDAHDTSYQLDKGLYYDTLDVIHHMFHDTTKIYQSLVMTPFLNQFKKQYDIYFEKKIPHIEVVSMRDELLSGNTTIFSNSLSEQMSDAMRHKNKIFLIHQRKGYHLVNTCRYCAYVSKCEKCQTSYHINDQKIMYCSLCGHEKSFEHTCPNHHDHMMKPIGIGLDVIVKQLKTKYPTVRIGKVDKDTKDIKKTIESLDIIVGTSVLKYHVHPYSNALIGVMIADVLWHHYDQNIEFDAWIQLLSFTNLELPFKKLKTIIQTYDTNHPVIKGLTHIDTFSQTIETNSEILMLPPLYKQYETKVFDPSYLKGYQHSLKLKNHLMTFCHIIGPRKNYESDDFFTMTFKVKIDRLDAFLEQIDIMKLEVYPI